MRGIIAFFAAFAVVVVLATSSLAVTPNSQYDKFKDITTISTGMVNIDNPDKAGGEWHRDFALSASYPGQVMKSPPDTVRLIFNTVSKQPELSSIDNVIFMIDGQRVSTKVTSYHTDFSQDDELEFLVFDLPSTDFTRLALAKKVEVQIGNIEFEFPQDVCTTSVRVSA